ncbi:MAG: MerR family transcriptional regulator [Thermodesulfobacteriota bacterium]|nr:MerR family transcriptional regulator [Thermodesulfobacteriota bacterium]
MIIPDKNYFRIGEVSRILGVEPYVVRYWESEFPLVRPLRTKSDQRLYKRKDVEQLLRIKDLLYQEMYTIAGARKRLININRQKEVPMSGDDGRLIDIKRKLREIRNTIG